MEKFLFSATKFLIVCARECFGKLTIKSSFFTFTHRVCVCVCRKIPILGKHTKRITYGAWSRENLLALGSDDRSVSVSNADGDTICQVALRVEPTNLQFSEMKQDERSAIGQNTVNDWSRFCVHVL